MSRSAAWRWAAVLVAGAAGVRPAAAQLPDGPGRSETVKVCSQCHAPEVVMTIRQDRAGLGFAAPSLQEEPERAPISLEIGVGVRRERR